MGQYSEQLDKMSPQTGRMIKEDGTVKNIADGIIISGSPTGASANEVQGNIAHSDVDAGKPVKVGGVYNSSLPTLANGDRGDLQVDASGILRVAQAYLQAGEDLANDVQKVEERYSYRLCAADTLVKTGAGMLHTLTFSPNDAVPTAGSIIIYDNSAESGTQIFNWNIAATAFVPFTIVLDVAFTTGLYIGFTTTADVNVTASYR